MRFVHRTFDVLGAPLSVLRLPFRGDSMRPRSIPQRPLLRHSSRCFWVLDERNSVTILLLYEFERLLDERFGVSAFSMA